MSWTIRTANGTTGTLTGGTPFTIPLPTGWQPGDLLVMIVSINPGTSTYTVTPPSGWTLIDQDDSGQPRSYFSYKLAGSTESAPSWNTNLASGFNVVYSGSISAAAGANSSAPLDVHAVLVESSVTTTHTTSSITPSQDNSLLVAAIGINTPSASPGTLTTSSPFTQQDTQATIGTTSSWEGISTDIQATAASISATFTSTSGTVGSKFIAAFAPTTIVTSTRTLAPTVGFKATNTRTVAPTTGLKATLTRTVTPTTGLKATMTRTLSASALLQSVRTLMSSIGLLGSPTRQITPTLLLTYHTQTPLHGATLSNGANDASLNGPLHATLTGSGGTKARLT